MHIYDVVLYGTITRDILRMECDAENTEFDPAPRGQSGAGFTKM